MAAVCEAVGNVKVQDKGFKRAYFHCGWCNKRRWGEYKYASVGHTRECRFTDKDADGVVSVSSEWGGCVGDRIDDKGERYPYSGAHEPYFADRESIFSDDAGNTLDDIRMFDLWKADEREIEYFATLFGWQTPELKNLLVSHLRSLLERCVIRRANAVVRNFKIDHGLSEESYAKLRDIR